MNEKHDFSLLRPVKFKVLAVGDKLAVKDEFSLLQCSVIYKSRVLVVLRFKDDSESTSSKSKLEINYGLAPLCWVEGKPVYPGDGPLYYKDDPAWMYNKEGVFATSVRDDELHFHGGTAFPIDTTTWAKPEQKREPSFQVEGQDVFPGDTVYYYGDDKYMWGREMIVEKDSCVNGVHAESFAKGAATFRLKPMLVIGDHLVPMPVRDAAEMKNGDCYYIPSLETRDGYLKYIWTDHRFHIEMYDKGLVHRTKEAASAHTGAFIALSKKKV